MKPPPVVAHSGSVPMYAFGKTFVYGVSPDFEIDVVLQEDNKNRQVKIEPKKSWEISENRIGSMLSWQPRTPDNDIQPHLSINLIDGNPDTYWCSRAQGKPDVEPVWIRIDLAKETNVREVVLVPSKDGKGVPFQLTVNISRDAWHWTTIYESKNIAAPKKGEPLRFPLTNLSLAKQIWIIGNVFPLFGGLDEHYFLLAEAQVIDESGENVALASRGASVTVSSTNYGSGFSRDVFNMLWPMQYDLGVKWMRLSGSNPPYHFDTLQWRFVEQEKGKYVIDEDTDVAITEAVNNGCKIMVILCYGNWLYASKPRQDDARNVKMFSPEWQWQKPDDIRPFPPVPTNLEMREGFKNWVRFMIRHFKNRVSYWEIWNEPNIGFGWEEVKDLEERVELYCSLVKEVAPIIREEDPKARISLAGMAGIPGITKFDWLRKCLEQDVFRLVDALSWHVQGACDTTVSPNYRNYPKAIRDFQRDAEAAGFQGEYMVSEYWVGAPYPPLRGPRLPGAATQVGSEVEKAKDTARIFMMNLGLSAISFWCNTWLDQPVDGGLLRNTFSSDPISPSQPQVLYYALRTLCTIMDSAKPTELEVGFSNKSREFDNYNFALPDNGLLVAVWLPDKSVDKHPGVRTDVVVKKVNAGRVVGIDTLNGFEQELGFKEEGDQLVIPNLLIRDYPMVLRLSDVKRKL